MGFSRQEYWSGLPFIGSPFFFPSSVLFLSQTLGLFVRNLLAHMFKGIATEKDARGREETIWNWDPKEWVVQGWPGSPAPMRGEGTGWQGGEAHGAEGAARGDRGQTAGREGVSAAGRAPGIGERARPPGARLRNTERINHLVEEDFKLYTKDGSQWGQWSEVAPDSVTPWTVAYQAPPMGFSRQEYWSGLPYPSPGDLLHPRIEPGSPEL